MDPDVQYSSRGQTSNQLHLQKVRTGVKGLDEVLAGGLPQGRPTLIAGAAGCGKTLMASEFLVRGALEFGEPGVYMTFEETPSELAINLASLDVNLNELIEQEKIFVDYVQVDRSEIEETGEYDLEGLFIRLNSAIEIVGAKRVVLDTLETIFASFKNEAILRSELRRLFHWLKEKGVTAVITAERGERTLTRNGLEEYVSDCVILLDHRVKEGIATRTLRVVKYRGSQHSSDEVPFLIDQKGIWVMPVTSVGLDYPIYDDHISSGIPRLDAMLDGKGYFRGSSILVSGGAGTGKTSLAAHLVNAACARGERCVYLAYEESSNQIIRNMRSIGLDLGQWVEKGLLLFQNVRPSLYGMEMHLLAAQRMIDEFKPEVLVLDPVTNLTQTATTVEVRSLLVRMIDLFKLRGITTMFTHLYQGAGHTDGSDLGASSLMDTWISLVNLEGDGERNRALYVLKSRGMAHSNQVREFRMSSKGIELVDVYVGPGGVLSGAARINQIARDQAETARQAQALASEKSLAAQHRKALEAQVAALQTEIEAESQRLAQIEREEEMRQRRQAEERETRARARFADDDNGTADPRLME